MGSQLRFEGRVSPSPEKRSARQFAAPSPLVAYVEPCYVQRRLRARHLTGMRRDGGRGGVGSAVHGRNRQQRGAGPGVGGPSDAPRVAVAAGLSRVLSDVPVRTGYVESQAGVSSLSGAYARLEGGARLRSNLGFFAFAEANQRERMAGAGMRWPFGW